jgi:hypothetical protein
MVGEHGISARHSVLWRRRSLLGAVAALAAPPATAPSLAASVPSGLRDRLAGLVADPDTARRLGRAGLAAGADPARLQDLLEALASAAARGPASVRALLAAERRRSFAAGDVAIVDGWVLARTEAELFALIALA